MNKIKRREEIECVGFFSESYSNEYKLSKSHLKMKGKTTEDAILLFCASVTTCWTKTINNIVFTNRGRFTKKIVFINLYSLLKNSCSADESYQRLNKSNTFFLRLANFLFISFYFNEIKI